MKKFIILDRDGVINYDSDDYIKSPEEWIPIPGSLAAIAKLKQAGFQIAVASNQSGIARGFYSEQTLAAIHQKMQNALAEHGAQIDGIFYCPHIDSDQCDCRKPKPGLFKQIATRFQIELKDIFYIGDKKSDVEVAETVACQPILVKTGYGMQTLTSHPQLAKTVPIFNDLAEAVTAILERKLP